MLWLLKWIKAGLSCFLVSDFITLVHNTELKLSLTDFQLICFIFFSSCLVTYQLY